MSLRTYVVIPKAGGAERLVKTTHPNRAISHVAADTLTARVASQEDMERLLPAAPVPTPKADEPATLNLGAICSRLGFTVSAAFLADVLHVQPAKAEKTSRLYTETQFATICRQLISHVGAMAELYAGEPA